MPRLSITLTDSQAEALDRIAATTGATKQSMIGLAVSDYLNKWEREHPRPATAPTPLTELLDIATQRDPLTGGLHWSTSPARLIAYLENEGYDLGSPEKSPEDGSEPVCEVCGRPAEWFGVDDEGAEHYLCDEHDVSDLKRTSESVSEQDEEPECFFTISRDGYEVAWYRGRWKDETHSAIVVSAMQFSRDGELHEMEGTWLYTLQEGESVFIVDIFDEYDE